MGKSQSMGGKISITTPTPTQSLTVTPVPTIVPASTVPAFPTITNPNLIRFTSQKLGISFTYLKSQNGQTISAKEINDKIYLYFDGTEPTNGQYVQVMPKDKNQTLEQAIKFLILNGYSAADCLLTPETQYVPTGFDALSIVVPINQNDDQATIESKATKCPQKYTAVSGMAYFIEDPNHRDRMFFLSIGQYLIDSEGNNKGWQDTIQVF